jgi:hypothetical protein
VFENRLLKRISGHKRDECRKLNEELHNLYTSSMVIKQVRQRWTGHVRCISKPGMCTKFLLGNFRGRSHFRDLDPDRRIILKHTQCEQCQDLVQQQACREELLGLVTGNLGQLNDYQLFSKDHLP